MRGKRKKMKKHNKTFLLLAVATFSLIASSCNTGTAIDVWQRTSGDEHSVTFTDRNGVPVLTTTVNDGEQVDPIYFTDAETLVINGLEEGWEFTRWDFPTNITINENTVFAAVCNIATFDVHFLNHLGILLETQTVAYGSDAIPPDASLLSPLEVFLGWYDNYTNVTSERFVYPMFDGVSQFYDEASKLYFHVYKDGISIVDNALGYNEPIIIPETINGIPVVAIGASVFFGKVIDHISIPDTVLSIGYVAFPNCNFQGPIDFLPSKLIDISWGAFIGTRFSNGLPILPDTLKYIGGHAFEQQVNVGTYVQDDYVIPASVESIGAYAFANAASFGKVIFENDMTTIPEGLFYKNFNISTIVFNSPIVSIGDRAFESCPKLLPSTGNLLDEGLEEIGISAFENSSISVPAGHITFPDSLKTISKNAFTGATTITGVSFGENLEYIGENSFNKCYAIGGDLIIPSSVTFIGRLAFSECMTNEDTLGSSIEIKYGLQAIGNYAFAGCFGAESVIIAESVVTIGMGAFFQLTRASVLDFNPSKGTADAKTPTLTTVNDLAFYSFSSHAPTSVGTVEVILPGSVTSIRTGSFELDTGTFTPMTDINRIFNISLLDPLSSAYAALTTRDSSGYNNILGKKSPAFLWQVVLPS